MAQETNPGNARVRLLLILCLINGIIFLVIGLLTGVPDFLFLRHASETATVKVISPPVRYRRFRSQGSSHQAYRFRYSFVVGGKTYEGAADDGDDPSLGVTVYYDRRDPSKNTVRKPKPFGGLFCAGIGAGLLVLAGILQIRRKRARIGT